MNRRIILDFLIPCLFLATATFLIAITGADVGIERLFYAPGSGWLHANDAPWRQLYDYGAIPGLLMGAAALVLFLAGFFFTRAHPYLKIALYFILVLALGPGLVTSALKDNWGRPRPRQVESLGGEKKYLPVWQPGVVGEGKSFPSGHASIAFYLFSPFFVLRRSSVKWAYGSLVLGLAYGTLVGLARMIQGGHFPSDVLWSAGFVYLTGLGIYYAFRMDRQSVLKTDDHLFFR